MTSPEQNHPPHDTLEICLTHAGGRDYNQDCCGSTKTTTPAGAFLIVCDGVGGGAGGERASETAVTTILEAVKQSQSSTEEDYQNTLRTALETAHKVIQDVALSKDLAGMATTVAAAWRVSNARALVAHLGDSRVYHCRKRGKKISIEFCTHDHSHVNELIAKGIVDKSEAKTHPSSHTITRALGFGSSIEPNFTALDLEKGDRIVVCSDGIWNLLEDKELAGLAYSGASVEDALKALVEEVHKLGEGTKYDNLTVGILDCADAPEPPRFSGFKAVWKKPFARAGMLIAGFLLAVLVMLFFLFRGVTFSQTTKGGQTETNPKKFSPKDMEGLGKYLQQKPKTASPSAKDSAKSSQSQAKNNLPKVNLSRYCIDPDNVTVLERIMMLSREDVEKFARETKFQDSSSQIYLKYLAVRYEQFMKEAGDYNRMHLEIDNGSAHSHNAVFIPLIMVYIYKKKSGEEKLGHRIGVQTGYEDYRSIKNRLKDGDTHHNASAKFTDSLK
ncbi:MAG: PP2C family protein-serine/threonine phosphatase [Candidatus Kapaibacteriota bacterium]